MLYVTDINKGPNKPYVHGDALDILAYSSKPLYRGRCPQHVRYHAEDTIHYILGPIVATFIVT